MLKVVHFRQFQMTRYFDNSRYEEVLRSGLEGQSVGCVNLLHEVIYRIKSKLLVGGHDHEDPDA